MIFLDLDRHTVSPESDWSTLLGFAPVVDAGPLLEGEKVVVGGGRGDAELGAGEKVRVPDQAECRLSKPMR